MLSLLLLQDVVELRYVKDCGEQKQILRGCHIDPTASHMEVKCTVWHISERSMWYGWSRMSTTGIWN